jgi:hypothetical protein
MAAVKKEIIEIFDELSPENQNTFLMYARVARAAERAIRKSINHALNVQDKEDFSK